MKRKRVEIDEDVIDVDDEAAGGQAKKSLVFRLRTRDV